MVFHMFCRHGLLDGCKTPGGGVGVKRVSKLKKADCFFLLSMLPLLLFFFSSVYFWTAFFFFFIPHPLQTTIYFFFRFVQRNMVPTLQLPLPSMSINLKKKYRDEGGLCVSGVLYTHTIGSALSSIYFPLSLLLYWICPLHVVLRAQVGHSLQIVSWIWIGCQIPPRDTIQV